MKSKVKTAHIGDEKIVKKFLWFPKFINGECCWLETAEWIERAVYSSHNGFIINQIHIPTGKTENFKWVVIKWL